MGADYESFGNYLPRSREADYALDLVSPHLIKTIETTQIHPVPKSVSMPMGPFSPELLEEPEIVIVAPAMNEDGSEYPLGATVQNKFKPPKYLRCGSCMVKVLETETENHVCKGD